MALPDVMQTGRFSMQAAKAAMATTGHNISNANTEGYNRQRTEFATKTPTPGAGSKAIIGRGVEISAVNRINDQYLEKQIRRANEELNYLGEKEVGFQHIEDVFNELDGEGLNRILGKFFNDFRTLASDPDNEAIRQSVRESAQALTNDFHRIRTEMLEVRRNLDSRLEGYAQELNGFTAELRDLNTKIRSFEIAGGAPNDLLDRRDLVLKEIGSYMNVSSHKDEHGGTVVDIVGIGPLVVGPNAEKFWVERSPADEYGKPEAAFDLMSSAAADKKVTHRIKGGKFGAILEVRDDTLSKVMNRLDELAYRVTDAVNQIHRQGFNRNGFTGLNFFKTINRQTDAAEKFDLSDEVKASVNNIAAAAQKDAPGDNRIAHAIAGIQGIKLMNEGRSTVDDFYNSIMSDVGVQKNRVTHTKNQQDSIMKQLKTFRDRISGVSLDEETANLLKYQHVFDASAKVISVADQMMEEVLNLR